MYRVIILLFQNAIGYRLQDTNTINMIRSYVANEWAPTILHCNLCWEKAPQIRLYKELFEAGIRISSTMVPYGRRYKHTLLFLNDLTCPDSEKLFNTDLLRFPHRWLVLYDDKDINSINKSKENIKSSLLHLPLLADSDFVLAERKGNIFLLTELHKPLPNGPTYSHLRGIYNESFLDIRPRREMFWRRKDIMGHPLTMSNVIQESNSTVYHLPREDRLLLHHDAIAKLCWSHVRMAFEMLNATPRYTFSYRWGYIKDGQWSGMINDLRTGKADLGTNCVANSKRLEVAVFTDSIGQFKVKFVFRQPPLSYLANVFALPFSTTVWVAIAFSAILGTFTVFLASKWEMKRIGLSPNQLDGSVDDALFLTLSAVSQQGCSKEPKGFSGRIMLWVIFAAQMALYAAYSANIVVLLQATSTGIRTVEQLSESGLTLGAIDTDYNRFVFRMFNDSVRASMLKKIEPPKGKPHYYNLYEGVEKIRQGFFAFHSTVDSIYRRAEETFLEMEKCDLREVDFMNARYPLVPIYKHSPYLELLRVALKRIRECGLQSALHGRLIIPKPNCAHRITAFSSVGLLNMRPVIYFMLYGIIISIFILLLEITLNKIIKK